MNPAILQSQFVQVALPIMFTVLIASWINNKAFDTISRRIDDLRADMNTRFGEVNVRLERIERKLDNHDERLVRLEERTSPVTRR